MEGEAGIDSSQSNCLKNWENRMPNQVHLYHGCLSVPKFPDLRNIFWQSSFVKKPEWKSCHTERGIQSSSSIQLKLNRELREFDTPLMFFDLCIPPGFSYVHSSTEG